MAAGDQISQQGQVEVRGYLMGEGTVWRVDVDRGGIKGVHDLVVRAQDTPYDIADGVEAGTDSLDALAITAAFFSDCSSAVEASPHLAAARVAWRNGGDVELHLMLHDERHLWFTGRCRGLTVDESDADQGCYRVLATFLATDPIEHEVVAP